MFNHACCKQAILSPNYARMSSLSALVSYPELEPTRISGAQARDMNMSSLLGQTTKVMILAVSLAELACKELADARFVALTSNPSL